MNQKQLRDYLFSDHYKAWPVQDAIKPAVDYQQYVDRLGHSPDEVVIAFGPSAGQTIPRSQAQYIRLKVHSHNTEHYYVRKSDVFQINTARLEADRIPSEYMICCYTDDYSLYHPEDMVLTDDSNWLPKDLCVVLEKNIYNDTDNWDTDIYLYNGNSVTTYDGEIIYRNDAVYCESDASYYHEDNEELHYCHERDYWVNPEDNNVCLCIDTDQYCLRDDAYYCYRQEEYFYYENNLPNRDHTQTIQEYHCGVEPSFYCQPIDQNKVLSKYTIGFEIEKDCLDNGDADSGCLIEQQPLFSHWETDSSCGIEGITNVYSLDNSELFINHVKESGYTDLNTNRRCGGHINVAHRENKLQYWHMRPWLGLIFSMWKKRLTNQYSSCNKKLNPYRGTDYHYGALVEKGRMRGDTRFELRLPNRVNNGDTIIRRFCLIQHLMECVDLYINEDFAWTSAKYDDDIEGIPNWVYRDDNVEWTLKIEQILKAISPQTRQRTRFFFEKSKSIIKSGYAKDDIQRVLAYAYAFQSYIDEVTPSGVINELTNPYINS